MTGNSSASEGSENIVALRRRSPQAQDHNLSITGAGKVRNGRGRGIRTPGPPVMSRLL